MKHSATYQPQNISEHGGYSLGRSRVTLFIESIIAKPVGYSASSRRDDRNDRDRTKARDASDHKTKQNISYPDRAEDRPAQLVVNRVVHSVCAIVVVSEVTMVSRGNLANKAKGKKHGTNEGRLSLIATVTMGLFTPWRDSGVDRSGVLVITLAKGGTPEWTD